MNEERYIQSLQRFATPEELDKLLSALGTPTDIEKRAIATDRLIEREKFKEQIRSRLWDFAKVIIAIGAVWAVLGPPIKALLLDVFGG